MKSLRRFLIRFAGLFRKGRQEREMAEEIESHFQMHVEENLRRGMDAEQALREAKLKFGGVEQTRESIREAAAIVALETTWRDLRYALRGLRRNPGFAATAIVSLGLGIGAAVAIFTLADNLLLRPLPYRDPNRLMMLWEMSPHTTSRNDVSPANYRDWKTQSHEFECMAVFYDSPAAFTDGTRVEELQAQAMSAELLPMLGVQPVRGRFFTAAEDMPGGPNVVLISYRLWQGWFGGEESAIGRTVQVRSRPATIVGVMPAGFYFRNRDVDLWEAMGLDPARDYRIDSGRYVFCLGRLKPGLTRDVAQTQMAAIARGLEREHPVFNTNWTVNVEPLRDSLVSEPGVLRDWLLWMH